MTTGDASYWRDEAWALPTEHQNRKQLKREMKPIQDELRALLQHAGRKSTRNRHLRRFACNLLKMWLAALWTSLTVKGVLPPSDAVERSLRGPVVHRKPSHGTRTDDGERFIERALSASVTCRGNAARCSPPRRPAHRPAAAIHSPRWSSIPRLGRAGD